MLATFKQFLNNLTVSEPNPDAMNMTVSPDEVEQFRDLVGTWVYDIVLRSVTNTDLPELLYADCGGVRTAISGIELAGVASLVLECLIAVLQSETVHETATEAGHAFATACVRNGYVWGQMSTQLLVTTPITITG